MERAKMFSGAYFFMFLLTLAFLGSLAYLALRGEYITKTDDYTVAVERSVPAEELQQLMGIGPVLAQAIVDYRAEHGAFASIDELLEISGIGESKLDNIRSDITLGGEDAA